MKSDPHELDDNHDMEWHKNSSFDDISSSFNIKKLRRSFSLGDLNELSIKTDCSEELDTVNNFSVQHQIVENQNIQHLPSKSSPHTGQFLNLTYEKSNETVTLSMSHSDHDHIKSSSPRIDAQTMGSIEEHIQIQVEVPLKEEKEEEHLHEVINVEQSQHENKPTEEPTIKIENVDLKPINESIKSVIQNVLFEPKIGKYLRENNNSFLFSSSNQDDFERFLNQISILQRYFDVLKHNHSACSSNHETDM
jgi:hypothetical protein